MKNLLLLMFLFFTTFLSSQNSEKGQEVNFNIKFQNTSQCPGEFWNRLVSGNCSSDYINYFNFDSFSNQANQNSPYFYEMPVLPGDTIHFKTYFIDEASGLRNVDLI